MQYLDAISKKTRKISVHFQGKLFNITVIQVYAPTSNAEEAEVEWFYEYQEDFLELTPKKDVLLIIGGWNAEVGSQEEIPGVTGLAIQNARAKAKGALPTEHPSHSKHPLPTTQEKTLQYGHHQMVNTKMRLIIFSAANDGEILHSQ